MKRLIIRFLPAADARKMTLPFHNRIRKVCPLVAATLIIPTLAYAQAKTWGGPNAGQERTYEAVNAEHGVNGPSTESSSEWYARKMAAKKSTAAKSPSLAPSPAAATGTPAAKHKAPAPQATQALGGRNGQVWVNTETHVYHKEGSKWYGKTKKGKYMTEADAVKEGDKPAKNEKQ